MTSVVHFASKTNPRKAALAALGPQIFAIAMTGKATAGYTVATAGDLAIAAAIVRPDRLLVIVQWQAARTKRNPKAQVFGGFFDPAGLLVGDPTHWQRGEWERLIFDRFRLSAGSPPPSPSTLH